MTLTIGIKSVALLEMRGYKNVFMDIRYKYHLLPKLRMIYSG